MKTCLECVSEDWLGRGSRENPSGVVGTLLGWWKPSWGGGNTSGVVKTFLGWWEHFWVCGNTSWVLGILLGWWKPFWGGENTSGVVETLLGWYFLPCYSPSLPFPLLPWSPLPSHHFPMESHCVVKAGLKPTDLRFLGFIDMNTYTWVLIGICMTQTYVLLKNH